MPSSNVLVTALLVGLVLVAAVTDIVRHRIYNWTTYPGILAALALATAGWALEASAPEAARSWRPLVGWLDLSDALSGFLLCGLVMVFCFIVFPIGGGDVKLLAMVGALAGLEKGLEVLLWTFIFGGCVGLVTLIWRMGPLALLKRAGELLYGVVTLGFWLRPPTEEQEMLKLPVFLGPCAAMALVAALVPWPWPT